MALLLALSWADVAGAQSLGEIARWEAERRKQTTSGKRYTNDDLRAHPRPTTGNTPPAVDSGATPPAETAKPSSDPSSADSSGSADETAPIRAKEHRDEEYWRERSLELRGHVERLRGEIAAVEGRLADLEAQSGASPSLDREREVSAAALAKLRRHLQFFTGEVERFEQRARGANVPADWIR